MRIVNRILFLGGGGEENYLMEKGNAASLLSGI